MRRRIVLIAAALALTTGALSPAPEWTVARAASSIALEVRAFGGTHAGQFGDWRADVQFDPAAPERTRATVTVQADSLIMRPAVATARATGPGFLDAARYPVIRLNLRSLTPLGAGRFTARADVTMRGQTRSVTFPVTLELAGVRAGMSGAFSLDRRDFDIGTTGPMNRLVGRDVTVRVALQMRGPG